MDGTEGDGWCPNATERARLRLELVAVRAATAEAAAQQQAAAGTIRLLDLQVDFI